MSWIDIRRGTDVEFGQSIYEPFGIAQIEPLSYGGVCVFSSVCGCAGFVDKITRGEPIANLIIADYTELPDSMRDISVIRIGQHERDTVEQLVARRLASQLDERLPRSSAAYKKLIDQGYAMSSRMSWDAVVEAYIAPGLEIAMQV